MSACSAVLFHPDIFSSAIFKVSIRNQTSHSSFLFFAGKKKTYIWVSFLELSTFYKCFPAAIAVIGQLSTVFHGDQTHTFIARTAPSLTKMITFSDQRTHQFHIFSFNNNSKVLPSLAAVLRYRVTGRGPTSRPSTVCHCLRWRRSRPSIMPSLDHGEDSLSCSIQ